MTEPSRDEILTRIAEALERQCETSQGWIALQKEWRTESQELRKREFDTALQHRDDELAEANRANTELLDQLRQALKLSAQTLALYERNLVVSKRETP